MKVGNGEEYLSSKDACAASGYSPRELWFLCLEGKVKSCWFRGGYFVEKNSLTRHLGRKVFQPHTYVDIQQGLDQWHARRFKKLGFVAVAVGVFLFILTLPMFLFQSNSPYNAAQTSSSYNSISFVQKEGMQSAAPVVKVNNAVSAVVGNTLILFYDASTSFFK